MIARASDKATRQAAVYDRSIAPLIADPAGSLLLRRLRPQLTRRPPTRVLHLGAGSGLLTGRLAALLAPGGALTAVEESPLLAARARERLGSSTESTGQRPAADLTWVTATPANWSSGAERFDLSVATVALGEGLPASPELAATLGAATAPGGVLAIATLLPDSWREFTDLYGEVLHDHGHPPGPAALAALAGSQSDVPAWLASLGEAGFADIETETCSWSLLFRSGREFFYAPVVELGPLSRWKAVAGRGGEMQDAFFFANEAIDTYFAGRLFAVTIRVALLIARRSTAGT